MKDSESELFRGTFWLVTINSLCCCPPALVELARWGVVNPKVQARFVPAPKKVRDWSHIVWIPVRKFDTVTIFRLSHSGHVRSLTIGSPHPAQRIFVVFAPSDPSEELASQRPQRHNLWRPRSDRGRSRGCSESVCGCRGVEEGTTVVG